MIRLLIDPVHVKEALQEGKCLMVQVFGDKMQFRRVSVIDRKDYPNLKVKAQTDEV